jgi:hypothetical protein
VPKGSRKVWQVTRLSRPALAVACLTVCAPLLDDVRASPRCGDSHPAHRRSPITHGNKLVTTPVSRCGGKFEIERFRKPEPSEAGSEMLVVEAGADELLGHLRGDDCRTPGRLEVTSRSKSVPLFFPVPPLASSVLPVHREHDRGPRSSTAGAVSHLHRMVAPRHVIS